MIRLVATAFALCLVCGCIAVTDEAIGVWENKTLPLQETMTIKSDGTYFVSGLNEEKIAGGTWHNFAGHYIFTPENSNNKIYGGIVQGGRGQVFFIIENVTYLKI